MILQMKKISIEMNIFEISFIEIIEFCALFVIKNELLLMAFSKLAFEDWSLAIYEDKKVDISEIMNILKNPYQNDSPIL